MTHASLFSGIGGAELAASWMGWTNAFHCEINPFARKILEYHFPNSISYEDITKTDFTSWRGRIDILTGGFPCQPFSVAGKRNGASDDRYLWPHMLRAIREIQPTWVVGENVAGLLTMVQPGTEIDMGRTEHIFEENYIYRKEQQFTIDAICEDLEYTGYSVQPLVIPACAVGAPHRRDRVWIVAHHTDTRAESLQQGGQDGIPEFGLAINTECKRRTKGGHDHGKFEIPQEKERRAEQFSGADSPQSWWRNFPTQSPICRGDDGLSERLDAHAISFSKWRAESVAAYGNAWVPQVAYEIFQAIELQQTIQS